MARADPNEYFRKGAEIEISSNDDGFRGAWYSGTVVRAPSKRSKNNSDDTTTTTTNNNNNKVLVEYKTLVADDVVGKPLREMLDLVQLRPPPPRELDRSFDFSEEVNAYYNDGWWEGVITEVLENERYSVFFRATREQLEFGKSELRLHREWVNGEWVPPLEENKEEVTLENVVEDSKQKVKETFVNGLSVEVSSDEEGFQGAWFAATVVEQLADDKILIQYHSLRNDDDTELLKEEVDNHHIRPHPPDVSVDHFNLHEEVDALHNDGWWVGVISKVLKGLRYKVYFRGTDEQIVFKHSDLRLHQDWHDGKWVMASRALKL